MRPGWQTVTSPRASASTPALLDRPGELPPLLTLGEAWALLYVAHLLGSEDAAATDAAREMETRLEHRLKVMIPE